MRATRYASAFSGSAKLFNPRIVCEGRECYVGLTKIAKATLNELLHLCLVSDDSDQGKGVERYTLNEDGRAILADQNYVPRIVRALTGNGSVER